MSKHLEFPGSAPSYDLRGTARFVRVPKPVLARQLVLHKMVKDSAGNTQDFPPGTWEIFVPMGEGIFGVMYLNDEAFRSDFAPAAPAAQQKVTGLDAAKEGIIFPPAADTRTSTARQIDSPNNPNCGPG